MQKVRLLNGIKAITYGWAYSCDEECGKVDTWPGSGSRYSWKDLWHAYDQEVHTCRIKHMVKAPDQSNSISAQKIVG